MGWKNVLLFIFSLISIVLLIIYWFFPYVPIDLKFNSNANFSVEAQEGEMQFYKNMRFPYKRISYQIADKCTLQKKGEMTRAFEIIEEKTLLEFYPLEGGVINVYCEDKTRIGEGGLFIAGEGGPSNVSLGKQFSVIQGGEILLIRNSNCQKPNVAIHELLHVLGFDHSDNPNNIMYPIGNCKQTIGDDLINKINELYSIPSLSDLVFENVSASMKGRTIDLAISVENQGLIDSESFDIVIYGDDKEIKRFESKGLQVGYREKITLTNQIISQWKINELRFVIENNFEELNKKNNEIILKQ